MNTKDERAAFEAWVSNSGRAHLLVLDAPNGWYKDLTVTAWWSAWIARAQLEADRAQRQAGQGDLTTGTILALERRSSMTDDEALRFARAVEFAVLRAIATPSGAGARGLEAGADGADARDVDIRWTSDQILRRA